MRYNEPIIKLFLNHKGYKYWLASTTILRKRNRKTFPYTDAGYILAELWLKALLDNHGLCHL